MPPAASTSRARAQPATASRKPAIKKPVAANKTSRPASTSVPISSNELAEKLANDLNITSKSKRIAVNASPVASSPRERISAAMRTVNTASQALAVLLQGAGTAEKRKDKASDAISLAKAVRTSLAELRQLSPGTLDTERAASSVVGKLLGLELPIHAFGLLHDMRDPLVSLALRRPSIASNPIEAINSPRLQDALLLIHIPIPPENSPLTDVTLITLVLTYLVHTLVVCSNFLCASKDIAAFANALDTQASLQSWISLHKHIPSKHTDILLTRAYSALSGAVGDPELNPADVLRIRLYALECLLLTSPSTVASSTFWDQTIKFAVNFACSTPALWLGGGGATFTAEREATKLVMDAFRRLHARVEGREDSKSFCSGKSYLSFCEYWLGYAKKSGDIGALDRVAAIMVSARIYSPEASTSSEQLSSPSKEDKETNRRSASPVKDPSSSSKKSRPLSLAQLCVPFVQATALFEDLEAFSGSDSDLKARIEGVAVAGITFRKYIAEGKRADNSEDERAEIKARKALERLRRSLVKCITSSLSIARAKMAKATLADVVQTLELLLTERATSDEYTSILDALFVLARTTLSSPDPVSTDAAYSFLSRTASIIGLEIDNSHNYPAEIHRPAAVPPDVHANFIRCISGAFHNLAGVLYQAERYGYAIRFLRHGCVLGELALELMDVCEPRDSSDESNEKQAEAWKQLQEQISRRWELLGVCYSRIADRKLAYDAYVKSISSYAFTDTFVEAIRTFGPGDVFNALPNAKQLGIIVDRVTYMAACELNCDPSQISIKHVLNTVQVTCEDYRACLAGLFVERQFQSLEGSLWKENLQRAAAYLLRDALCIYDAKTRPIRRASVMLKCLELLYYAGKAEGALLEILSLDWEHLLDELNILLKTEDLQLDIELSRFLPFYKATVHLWLALHAHRNQDLQQSELAASHIQEVCRVLRPIVMPSTPASPAAHQSPLKPTRKGSARTPNVRAIKTPARKAVNKTPRKPKAVDDPVRGDAPAKSLSHQAKIKFYGFRQLFELLRMGVDLMGFFAHVILKVQLLHVTRRFCEAHAEDAIDEYMISSIDLAYEYLKLGKLKKAGNIFNKTLSLFKAGAASDETRVLFLLRHTEALALLGESQQRRVSRAMQHAFLDRLGSSISYAEAASLAEGLATSSKDGSSTERMRIRIEKMERAALAASAFSEILIAKDEPAAALEALLQSLRLWNRALTLVERVGAPPAVNVEPNPFDSADSGQSSPDKTGGRNNLLSSLPRQPKAAFKGLEWQIASGLLATLLAIAELYFARGSAREAQYFSDQAGVLAQSISAPALLGCALARKGDVQLRLGRLEEAYETLVKAAEALGNREGPELAEVHRLYADLHTKDMKDADAGKLYREATSMLEDVGRRLSAVDGLGLRRSSMGMQGSKYANASDMLAPELLSTLLRRYIWLLRHDLGDEYQVLLEKLSSLPASSDMKAEEESLLAKLTLHDAFDQLRENISLSSITESVITLPMGTFGDKASPSIQTQDISRLLGEAESLFWSNLNAISRRGKAHQVRETATQVAFVRSLQASMGKGGGDVSLLIANLLDASAAITLHREVLEVIPHKFPETTTGDDLEWPALDNNGVIMQPQLKKRRCASSPSPFAADGGSEDEDVDTPSLLRFWNSRWIKYSSNPFSLKELSSSKIDSLPDHWSIIHISVTEDKSTMFISRQRAKQQPLVFCLPLKGRRDSEEDEHLTLQDALNELKDIVRLNDETTRQAIHVKAQDREARAAWWAERIALDKRLQDLLENIEFCWLGAFKTILSEPTEIPLDVVADLRSRLDGVFKRGLVSQDKKQKTRVRIDDSLLQCFSSLSPKCRDEELEDLVYFILDLYQFHGVHVAIAEVDVDHVVVDLRTALEEHAAKARRRVKPIRDNHTFLVLDKNVQGIPWESIPMLRGRSISRVPSLEFLLDRLDMAGWERGTSSEDTIDRVELDARSTFYILNPSGDLAATEKRFSGWLEKMRSVGWEGIVGKAPSEQQVVDALSRKDLLIYFGHGGAEQFVRSHKVRHLQRCAAVMLWGCSSGLLRDMGELDRVGTPFNYMLGGCSSLVANLWDVTDRDIDKLSQAVFDELALTPEGVKRSNNASRKATSKSITQALARSREVCKLKYLTGASPVIYGIPFYL